MPSAFADPAPDNMLPLTAMEGNAMAITNTTLPHWVAGKNDGKIAFTVAEMLEKCHYLHLPFDTNVSSKFLDLYINAFDPRHDYFLQSDLTEFNQYRAKLGEMTLKDRDTTPAYLIFNRFMQRLQERVAYTKTVLQDELFQFDGKERISLNRKNAPFPKDIEEAHNLWRERLRFEYLSEKLDRENPKQLAALFAKAHNPIDAALVPQQFRQGIVKFIDTRYNRIFRLYREWESDKVLETYLTSLTHVYDPHSEYDDQDSHENFAIQMNLSLFGIGAVLTSDDDGYCQIVSLQPGMPAAKTKKLKPGDRIIAVAQGSHEPVDVVQMPLNKVVDLIRGPKDTEVRLTILPKDSTERAVIRVVRDEIKLEDQQAKAKLIEIPGADGHAQKLGVIDLPSFYASFPSMNSRHAEVKSATVDVDLLLNKLKEQQVEGVILDLRHNPGGALSEAVELTGLFIKDGPVVQTKSADGSIQVDEDRDPTIQYNGPMVVLIDRFSASASEIVAGALQDYGRAVVVGGQSTHGKGTVQTVIYLASYLYQNGESVGENPASLGSIRFTTNKFYRVTGSSTQLKGVVPDIILPSPIDYWETEEGQSQYAMPWDEISPTDFNKLDRVQPYLSDLKKRSTERVAASKDYSYINEDIAIVKKAVAEKSSSLNESERLKENADTEARKKREETELKSRKPDATKIYDLTLKNNEVEMKLEPVPDYLAVNSKTNSDATVQVAKKIEQIKPDKLTVPDPGSNDTHPDSTTVDPATDVKSTKATEPPSPEEKAPLEEAEHILTDYISLLHANSALTAEHTQPATP